MNAYKVWDNVNKSWIDFETGCYGINPQTGKLFEYWYDGYNENMHTTDIDSEVFAYTLLDINNQGLYYGHIVEVYAYDYGGNPEPMIFGIETSSDVNYIYTVMEFINDTRATTETNDYIKIIGHVAEK